MVSIHAHRVFVDFPIYGAGSRSLKKKIIRAATGGTLAKDAADHLIVRALDDVSFEIRAGERVGLVGHNGSGKTTLLRTIVGVYEPISGEMEVHGSIASMLSVTLGMEMEATGFENLYLRGAVMGMRKEETDFLVAEIAEFSELGDYLNMPMRTYSSGMMMRLAFSMATSVNADIVLMDEWLSVGDQGFSAKAERRLKKMIDNANILLLASHDQKLLSSTCDRIIHLEHGKIIGS